MTIKKYREFINKYKIPEEEMDDFIIQTNKPVLLKIIANLKESINEILTEYEEELEE